MDRKTALWMMNRLFDTCISVSHDRQHVIDQINECRKYIRENLK